MGRGVVLWPDETASDAIRSIWQKLEECHVPSLASFTHRRHRPHLTLAGGEDLPAELTLELLGDVPGKTLDFQIESVGVFPPGGTLVLGCVVTRELLAEHRRVYDVITRLVDDPWPMYRTGRWVPHLTVGRDLDAAQMSVALPLALEALPIGGRFALGGVEDGTSGESWPSIS